MCLDIRRLMTSPVCPIKMLMSDMKLGSYLFVLASSRVISVSRLGVVFLSCKSGDVKRNAPLPSRSEESSF